jgi:hypothetical protein
MKRLSPAVLASALVMLVVAPSASADDTQCVAVLPPGTYDNVVVPPGAECLLTNVVVRGNVKALENSELFIDNSQIRQNVIGDKAEEVFSVVNRIGGNLDVKDGTDLFTNADTIEGNVKIENLDGDIEVLGNNIPNGDVLVFKSATRRLAINDNNVPNGSVRLFENQIGVNPLGNALFVVRNQIGSDGQVFKNRGPGGKVVATNTVDGNLQCKENDPLFVGQPNVVGGNAEDQCAQPGP